MSIVELRPLETTPVVARAPMHHASPPMSPARLLCSPWSRLLGVAGVFVTLAVAASVNRGWLLLHVDEPITRFVVDHRTPWLDETFRRISFMGSTRVVLVGGVVLAALAWRRCRSVAALVVVATLTRPLLEFTLKRLVGRERPSLDRLVVGTGPSFPSGHPMAAATLWLMVPVVLSLYHRSARVWWVSAAFSLTAVGLIGASRVYLGVHWASDVVGGALAAAVLLTALDLGFRWLHGRHHCGDLPAC